MELHQLMCLMGDRGFGINQYKKHFCKKVGINYKELLTFWWFRWLKLVQKFLKALWNVESQEYVPKEDKEILLFIHAYLLSWI